VTITVKPSGLPSAATPGAQVDVIFRITPTKDQTIPEVTRVLMQGVEILAIGENSTKGLKSVINPKAETQTVILALSGDQAMRLKAAEGHGELSLALRGPNDQNQSLENSNLTLRELLQLPPIVAAPPPTPPFVTEIYRRGRRETLSFGPMGIITSSPNKRAAPLPVPTDDQRQVPNKQDQDHIIPAPPAEPPFLPGPDRPQVPPGDKDQKLTNQVIEYRSKIIPGIPLAVAD
jgi:hypothetical protein